MDYLEKLQDACKRRHQEWGKGSDIDLSFRGLELAGEVGEVCNELKKLERVRLGLVGGKTDLDDLKEELADVLICVGLIAMDLDIDLGPEIQKKFDKTSQKYDLKTRFDEKKERLILETIGTKELDYEPLDLDEIQNELQRVDDRPKKKNWEEDPATPKQISFLRKLGYGGSENITKSEASNLIPVYKEKRGYEK